MKEGAENVQTKVQAKLDSVVKNVGDSGKGKFRYSTLNHRYAHKPPPVLVTFIISYIV